MKSHQYATTESARPRIVLSRLRDVRHRVALSQVELADLARVSRTTVIRLEHGDSSVHPATLRRLARALRVKPADLIGD